MLPPALYSTNHQSSRSTFALILIARSIMRPSFVWRPYSSSFKSPHLVANQSGLFAARRMPPMVMFVIINRLLNRHLQTSTSQKPVVSRYLTTLSPKKSHESPDSRRYLSGNPYYSSESRSLSPFKVSGLFAGLGLIFYGLYHAYYEYLRFQNSTSLDYNVPPVPLPRSNEELLALPPNQRVTLVGRFEHENEQFLGSRKNLQIPDGQSVSYWDRDGYYLLTPFVLSDGSKRRLLVNRGWISTYRKEPWKRSLGQVEGEVVLNAYVRPTEAMDIFTEARTMMRLERWHYSQERLTIDLDLMSRKLAVDPVALFIADYESGTVKGGPVGGQLYIPEENEMPYMKSFVIFFAGVILIKAVFM